MTTDNTSEPKDTRSPKYKYLGDVAYELWTRFNGQCQSRGYLWMVEQTLGELQDDTAALDALGLVKKEEATKTLNDCLNGIKSDEAFDVAELKKELDGLYSIHEKLQAKYAALAASHAWMLERLKFVDGQYILGNPEPVWREQIAIAEALQSSLQLKGAE